MCKHKHCFEHNPAHFSAGTTFQCVVAADVFVYIGDLQPVMSAAAAVCARGALFAFSVEAAEHACDYESCSDLALSSLKHRPYSLQCSGRYVHTTAYCRDVLSASGWQLLLLCEGLKMRSNAGKEVKGHLCVAIRL